MIEVRNYDIDILKRYGFYQSEIKSRLIHKLTDHISMYINKPSQYDINSQIGYCINPMDNYDMSEIFEALDKSMILVSKLTKNGIIEVR